MKKKNTKKGFTLAELLVVVAIIGVLVAIAIPVFTAQLDKAKAATDDSNIRAAYAIMRAAELTGEMEGVGAVPESGTWYFQNDGTVKATGNSPYELQGKHDSCSVPGINATHNGTNKYIKITKSADDWELTLSQNAT